MKRQSAFSVSLWIKNYKMKTSPVKRRQVEKNSLFLHIFTYEINGLLFFPACCLKFKTFLQRCPHCSPPHDNKACGVTPREAVTCCPLIIFTTGSLDSLHSSTLLQNNPFRAKCHSAHEAGITSTSYPTNRQRS